MRILFAGSPGIAIPALESLFRLTCRNETGRDKTGGDVFELAGVLTNPDTPKGRSGVLLPTEIGTAAERLSAIYAAEGKQPLVVLKPHKLDAPVREQVAALRPDLLVSFAYGRIFGPKFLEIFPMGGINIHPSLLPKYRGPTPIPAAILNHDRVTGISVQRLAAEMDSGDILTQERVLLSGRETTGDLSGLIAGKAAEMLPLVLHGIGRGTVQAVPQNHSEASYCSLIAKEDGRINWNTGAPEIDARIRAFDPWPQCWTMHGDLPLLILKAEALPPDLCRFSSSAAPGQVTGIDKERGILVQTGEGLLAVTELQYRTKKALKWKDFLNGARNFAGSVFDC